MAIYGVSFDTPAENAAFRAKQGFGYPLWSDIDKALALHYGAATSKLQPYAGRVTVILDPQGTVYQVIPNAVHEPSAAEHAQTALQILDARAATKKAFK